MRAALAAGVVLIVAMLFASAAASAASADRWSVAYSDTPEHPPLARMSQTEARERGLAEPELARARRLQPEAVIRVRWLADEAAWRVSVRARVDATTLAWVEIDDASGSVRDRYALPIGDYPPRHTEREAIDAAVADSHVRRLARQWGGVRTLRAAAAIEECCWRVDLYDAGRTDGDPDKPVIRAEVRDSTLEVTGAWTGLAVTWPMARGERDAFGGDLNEPAIWYALMALFTMVVVDWRRLRSLANVDALALVVLAASYEAFVHGAIDWSVPLAVPPLAWLALRMGWLFARGVPAAAPAREPRTRFGRLALRRVSTVALVVACVALAGVRIGLTLDGGNVIDVGYASVAGARLELDGTAPWGNMPQDVRRGDTYGPVNYLAYVPATALLDDDAAEKFGEPLVAAQATSIAADLGCALLLALIGWRWLSRRAAALLALGWLACPWTTLVLASGANDSLVALALLGAFAALPRAWLRGALVGAAAMVKLAPAIAIAPLLHVGATHRTRQALLAAAGFALAIAVGLAWVVWRIDHGIVDGLQTFWRRTVTYQVERDSPFSPWGLYGWDRAQTAYRVVVVALAVLAFVRPRARDAWQVAAGIAALVIAVQLAADHWFYLYVPWFVPFVLLVLVARRERPGGAGDAPGAVRR